MMPWTLLREAASGLSAAERIGERQVGCLLHAECSKQPNKLQH